MLVFLLKLIFGAFLITLPFWLTTNLLRKVLIYIWPKGKKFIKVLIIILHGIILDSFGLHLVLDPIIPGQGIIYVHITKLKVNHPFIRENLRIEIAPIKFNGHQDFQRIHFGSFDNTGTYSALVTFDWGESQIFVRVYDKTQPNQPLIERYIHISPYVRVGLNDKYIYLRDNNFKLTYEGR
jgi:hypothetical protein